VRQCKRGDAFAAMLVILCVPGNRNETGDERRGAEPIFASPWAHGRSRGVGRSDEHSPGRKPAAVCRQIHGGRTMASKRSR
jgi:hypothetical protein